MKNVIEPTTSERIQLKSNPQGPTKNMCNYQNNYYGDQICVLNKKAKVSYSIC